MCVELMQELGPFELHPGLFYLNSIEWAASAMEMSALAGWNVANLAASSGTKSSGQHRQSEMHEKVQPAERVDL
jgi:hypothetical protein